MKENRSRRIIKVAQQIKSIADNGGKIWEIKRYYQIWKTTESKVITDFWGIQEILWKSTEIRQSETAEETQIQCKVGNEC